jgi:hypothetical protein
MVGVTGFEPGGLFVANWDQVAAVLLSTRGGVPSAFLLGPHGAREALTISGAGLWPAGMLVG